MYSEHRLVDARILALLGQIARKVSRNPDLLATPRRILQRWKHHAAGKTPKYLVEWETALEQPTSIIVHYLKQ